MRDHIRIDLETDALEEVDEPDALDHFTDALVLQSVLGEEIDGLLRDLHEPLVVLLGLELHERHHYGAEEIADL